MPNYLPHVASRLFGTPLLIAPRKLDVILHAIGARLGLQIPENKAEVPAVATTRKPYAVTPDGIAVINVAGSLVRKGSYMTAASGLTSYADVEEEFLDAATDPNIKGILLDIDSLGGEAGGVFDLSDEIYAQRGSKPIYAVANDDMYSAAYAIGSAADKIFLTRTGGVGSIGVICLHVDESGADEKAGLKYTAIYAGSHKNDMSPYAPISDAALATTQAEIDRLYGMFTETVGRNRGMSVAKVIDTQAGLFFGTDAINVGLADSIGNFADALTALTVAVEPKRIFQNAGTSVAANSTKGEVTLLSNPIQTTDPTPVEPDTEAKKKKTETTMYCTGCGAELDSDDNYCPSCGAAVDPDDTTTTKKTSVVNRNLTGASLIPGALAAITTSDESLEIMELCALAGTDLKTAIGYSRKGMTASQVRRDLADQRHVANSQNEVVSAVSTATGTEYQIDMSKPENNPLLKALESFKASGMNNDPRRIS